MSPSRKTGKSASSTPNGASPASNNRKRKAGDLDSGPAKRSTPVPKPQRHKSQGTPTAAEPAETSGSTPFTVEYPAKPPKPGKPSKGDVFYAREAAFKDLEIDYAVRPGGKWATMKTYKNVKLSEQLFSIGSVIYVNRHSPIRPPPPPDAPAEELLKFDRQNFWVGHVLECRAISERDVFLRIFWLYWPEELPNGRESYHGEKELIMSNAMEIIDAQSISSAAEVSYWDEKDEEGDGQLKERFWRQTLDMSKLKGKKGGLSEVRRHCTCQTQYNPDKTMYKCVNEQCGIWNHLECLVTHVLDKTYHKALTGQLTKEDMINANGETSSVKAETTPQRSTPSVLPFAMEKVENLFHRARDMMTPDTVNEAEETVEAKKETTSPRSKAAKKVEGYPWSISMAAPERSWKGKFAATVRNVEDGPDGTGRVVAHIEDLRGGGGSGKKGGKKGDVWIEDVHCLRCGNVLL